MEIKSPLSKAARETMSVPRSLRIHHLLEASRANGPGVRAVVWTQGCSLGCPGCFNPQSHPAQAGSRVRVDTLARSLLALAPGIEGVTISGGEPFQQAPALAELTTALRAASPLSIIVFSGYSMAELQRIPAATAVIGSIDLLIAGRYEHSRRVAAGLLGSANKSLHFFTQRYTSADLEEVPEAEVLIESGGGIVLSGIEPLQWRAGTKAVD